MSRRRGSLPPARSWSCRRRAYRLPSAYRVTSQRSDAGGRMRPAVERDDACAVNHLVQDDHVIVRLHQLHVVVVGARDHRRTRIEAEHAALGERPFLRVVVLAAASGSARLRFRGERRDPAVRRIHDQRRLLRDSLAEVPPEVVVRALDVGGRAAASIVLVGALDPLLRELLGLFVADGTLAGECAGPFERRQLREVPRALKVGVAVRRARHLRLHRLGGNSYGGEEEDPEENGTHTAAPFVVRPIIIGGRKRV